MVDCQIYKIKKSYIIQLKDTKIDMVEFDAVFEGNGYIGDEIVVKIRPQEFGLAAEFAPKNDTRSSFFELVVFKSGVFIITDSTDRISREKVDEFAVELIEKCKTISKDQNFNILEEIKYPSCETQDNGFKHINFVALTELEKPISLTRLAEAFSNTEYQPEEFSLLMFRINEPKTTAYISEDGFILIENRNHSIVLAALDKLFSYRKRSEGIF